MQFFWEAKYWLLENYPYVMFSPNRLKLIGISAPLGLSSSDDGSFFYNLVLVTCVFPYKLWHDSDWHLT